jgi:hypothetical protein
LPRPFSEDGAGLTGSCIQAYFLKKPSDFGQGL